MAELGQEIPYEGMDGQALLEHMASLRGGDVRWREGRAFGLVYHHSESHTELLKAAHSLFFSENALNPMAFKSLQRMEREVVRMTARMFHGGTDVVGSMTSGGTESLLLTVLTYRNHARRHRWWVRRPEIVVPESAHVAFSKAGEYFGVKIVRTPLDGDCRADVPALERRIGRNTIGIVGSAPCYPYGTVDPIEAMGAVALRHKLPLHVDGCLGGFFLPWLEQLGHSVPPFDFRVPGVTSISADVHKYGYAAKGASTILYKNVHWFKEQIFAEVDWCGGAYGGATLAGTRPGGVIAAAWASLHALGVQGFKNNASAIMETAARFKEGIQAIPELALLGQPAMGVLAFTSKDKRVNVYAVADQLEQNDWHVDRLQRPAGIHLIVNPGHAHVVEKYLADLREAVDYVKTHPDASLEGNAPMYGIIAKMPLRGMVKKNVVDVIARLYTAPEAEAGQTDATDNDGMGSIPWPAMAFLRAKARLERLLRPSGGTRRP